MSYQGEGPQFGNRFLGCSENPHADFPVANSPALNLGLVSSSAPSAEMVRLVNQNHYSEGALPSRNEGVVDAERTLADQGVEVHVLLLADWLIDETPGS